MNLITCPTCGSEIEDLGTAGFNLIQTVIINGIPTQRNQYHNRHDRKCPKCNTRYDINDCSCGADHEISNSLHHGTSHFCTQCNRGLSCDEAHNEDLLECGHDKPQQIHAKKEFNNRLTN